MAQGHAGNIMEAERVRQHREQLPVATIEKVISSMLDGTTRPAPKDIIRLAKVYGVYLNHGNLADEILMCVMCPHDEFISVTDNLSVLLRVGMYPLAEVQAMLHEAYVALLMQSDAKAEDLLIELAEQEQFARAVAAAWGATLGGLHEVGVMANEMADGYLGSFY